MQRHNIENFFLLVCIFACCATSNGNIRKGVEETKPFLQTEQVWFLDPFSFGNQLARQLLAVPVILSSFSDLSSSELLHFRLNAIGTFEFVLQKQPNGFYSTRSFKTIAEGTGPNSQAAERVVAIVAEATNFRVEGKKLWIEKGYDRAAFDLHTEKQVSASPLMPLVPELYFVDGSFKRPYGNGPAAYPKVRDVGVCLPETYMVRNQFAQLFGGKEFPIYNEYKTRENGVMRVDLHAINTFSYTITYNNADGWVNKVILTGATNKQVTLDQMETETKLKNIFSNVQQIAFEIDGRIQFITEHGATRITFRSSLTKPSTRRVLSSQALISETRSIVKDWSQQKGLFLPLFDGVDFSVTLVTTRDCSTNSLNVEVNGIGQFIYNIQFEHDTSFLLVSAVNPVLQITASADRDKIALQDKINNVIANAEQVVIERNGLLNFVTDDGDGDTRVFFDLPQNDPERDLSYDRFMCTNDAFSTTTTPIPTTTTTTTRAAPVYSQTKDAKVDRYVFVSGVFFENGEFRKVFEEAEAFPIVLHTTRRCGDNSLVVHLTGLGQFKFELQFFPKSLKVADVKLVKEIASPAQKAQMDVQVKINDFFKNVENVEIDEDGLLTFVANKSRFLFYLPRDWQDRRLAYKYFLCDFVPSTKEFDLGGVAASAAYVDAQKEPLIYSTPSTESEPASFARPGKLTVRYVVPETCFIHGNFEPLYSGDPFPISVRYSQPRRGFMDLQVVAINTFKYAITYNEADGWVAHVTLVGETNRKVSTRQFETELILRKIFSNVQQIAFEKDGRVQFISDNGSTRMSFDPRNDNYPIDVPETRTVLSASYFKNDKLRALLFPPTSITTTRRAGGAISVQIRGNSHYSYDFVTDEETGVVLHKSGGEILNGSNASTDAMDKLDLELKIMEIISRSDRVVFDEEKRLNFIASSGQYRITFEL